MVRFRRTVSLLTSAYLLVLGCSPAEAPESILLKSPLSNGQTVRETLMAGQRSVILVYSPAMCYSCSTMLTEWEQLERAGLVKLTLLMSPPPSPEDLRALQRQRIRVDGLLRSWPASQVPSELVFEGDSLYAAAFGAREVATRALARGIERSLTDATVPE